MPSIRAILDSLKGFDRYVVRDGAICRKFALFREEILPIDEIAGWSIHPEMIFDVVEIRRKDGATWIWLDYFNDLKAILDSLPAGD